MKAETAIISINGRASLKVLLLPETEEERTFLATAQESCEDFAVKFEDQVREPK